MARLSKCPLPDHQAIKYRVVVPRNDNHTPKPHPIKQGEIDNIRTKISKKLGGATVWDATGCWRDGEDEVNSPIICDKNAIMETVASLSSCDDWERYEKTMNEISNHIGTLFGQSSIFVSSEPVDVSYIPGEFKAEVPKELRAGALERAKSFIRGN